MGEAARLGVSVHICRIEPDDVGGFYDDDERRIYIKIGMTIAGTKQVLAHELAHAHYGHPCSSGRNEHLADQRAARLLVDLQEYRRAERISSMPAAIADELNLTEKVVRDFQRWLADAGPQSGVAR